MRKAISPALAIAVCLFCGWAAAQEQQQTRPPAGPGSETGDAARAGAEKAEPAKLMIAAPVDSSYEIGPEDIISVWVFQQPSMNGTFTVGTDGMVGVPLIGQIKAGGKTRVQVEAEVIDRLKSGEIVIEPNVTVNVLQVNSKKVYISGEGVSKNCEMALVVPTRVSEALAYAGGFRDFAKVTRIRIIRVDADGTVKKFTYNDKQVSHGQHLEQNILLKPGDHIYVDD